MRCFDYDKLREKVRKVYDKIFSKHEDSPEGFLAAEMEACGQGYPPPYFTETGYCRSCGKIRLHPYKNQADEELRDCPWCQSGWSAIEDGLGI